MLSIHSPSSPSIIEIIGSSLLHSFFFNDSVLEFPLTQKKPIRDEYEHMSVMSKRLCLWSHEDVLSYKAFSFILIPRETKEKKLPQLDT